MDESGDEIARLLKRDNYVVIDGFLLQDQAKAVRTCYSCRELRCPRTTLQRPVDDRKEKRDWYTAILLNLLNFAKVSNLFWQKFDKN